MRKNVRLLLSLVLTLSMLLGMGVTAFATTADEATLSLRADDALCHAGQTLTVAIDANVADRVTDGKLTLRYADGLTLLDVSEGAAWTKAPRMSLNTEQQGALTLTFAAEKAAAKGEVFTLTFRVEREGEFEVSLTGGYLTGIENAKLASSVKLTGTTPAAVSLRAPNANAAHTEVVEIVVDNNDERAITDGKLTFEYDGELTFVEVLAGEAWQKAPRIAVNAEEGKLTLTFAAEKAAGKGELFVLRFSAENGEHKVRLTGGYLTGIAAAELNSEVTVNVSCYIKDFKDCNAKSWYHESIDYVVAHGLMDGMGNKEFMPNEVATRAMVVTVLYRMAGSPEVEGTHNFKDVDSKQWYADAILWAYQQGIAKGIDKTHFAPNEGVTREMLVAFMARFAEYSGLDITPEGTLDGFKDGKTVLPYAKDYMIWAVDNGLIQGMNNGKIEPKTLSTRAMLATVLMRLDRMLEQ